MYNRSKKRTGINNKDVKRVMVLTRTRRHQWIITEHPLVATIVAVFPCLEESPWVRRHYISVTNACIVFYPLVMARI